MTANILSLLPINVSFNGSMISNAATLKPWMTTQPPTVQLYTKPDTSLYTLVCTLFSPHLIN